MPGNVRPVADERDGLLSFLAQQRYAIRVTAHEGWPASPWILPWEPAES